MQSKKPDLIVCWPIHLDYPLFRQMIKFNRPKFNKVIVVLTNMNTGKNYADFIRDSMKADKVTILDCPTVSGEEDWRNVATNKALRFVKSEWVFFTEQDFTIKDGFWDFVQEQMKEVDYLGALIEGRVHPCCILITTKLLRQTSCDFSVIKDVSDHFSRLQNELSGKPFCSIPSIYWSHMGGLSQNMHMLINGQNDFYMPDDFKKYVRDCMGVYVPLHEDFLNLFNEYLGAL